MNRSSDGSPGNRRGVGNQIQRSCVERLESQSDHECAGNRDRRAEAGRSFNEGSKTKSHQQHLQPAVGGDSRDRLLHDFELSGLDRNIVEVHGSENDPCDFQNTKGHAVPKAEPRQCGRHFEKDDRDQHRRSRSRDGAPVRLHFQAGEQAKENNDRKSRNQRGEPPMTEWIVDLCPLHNNLLANGVSRLANAGSIVEERRFSAA